MFSSLRKTKIIQVFVIRCMQTRRAALPPARLCLLLRESNETSVGNGDRDVIQTSFKFTISNYKL